jgi:hypothetical protein
VDGLDDTVKLAARQLAISRLRLVELMTLLPEDHSLLVAERKLAIDRQAGLRRSIEAAGRALDRERLRAAVAALKPPDTKEEAVEVLSLVLLYEMVAGPLTPKVD